MQQRALKQGRIDKRDDVALVHTRVEIHIKFRNCSRYLRTHLHGNDRINRSGGLNDVVYFTLLDFRREVLHLAAAIETKRGNNSDHNDQTY